MMRTLALLLLLAATAAAQDRPIQDNSFLLEEAYNQEEGVVQHISFFTRAYEGGWEYAFTQEWPVPGQKHQLSYTLHGIDPGEGGSAGFGDVLINYRYQLLGSGDTKTAFAPRISLILPTGSLRRGRSEGGTGFQFNLPLSVQHSPYLVTHWNAGGTIIPAAENELGEEADRAGFHFGQSFIWLANPRFNVMLETLYDASQQIVAPARTDWSREVFISPGIRWAHNFASGLQIVPGVAFPFGAGPDNRGDHGIIFYLSFEHPFRRIASK
jgi:hypothetical protein